MRSCAVFCLFMLGLPEALAAAEKRPNLVIILADDLGFADLGCYGSEIQTPTLDRLAQNGLRFTQFYNTARCWPSRAALMTGHYPHQAHMAMIFGDQAPPAYSGNIPHTCRMIPELLQPLGYRSYHVGKWHLNNRASGPNDTWPLGRGFQHSYFLLDTNRYFGPRNHFEDDRKLPPPDGSFYLTESMSDRAVGYLRDHAAQHADQPFFLYLAYTAPHFPLHALPEDVAHYHGKYRDGWDRLREARYRRMKELGIVNCALSPRDPDAKAWDSLSEAEKDEWDARMATYAAMIHCIDRGVGRLIKQLEAMHALDNTLVLFLSDNGSSAEYIVRGDGHKPGAAPGSPESFRCLEVGWSNVANTPFRMHKIWVHEGGISTPLIAHWPAGIKARGERTHTVGHLIDVVPTFLEVTGAAYPTSFKGEATVPLPGRSLAPLFQGKEPRERDFLFWEHQGSKAIRKGNWKLVAEAGRSWELYNLREDRCELNDLSRGQPDKLKELAFLWAHFAQKIGVVDWDSLPQSRVRPSSEYRKK